MNGCATRSLPSQASPSLALPHGAKPSPASQAEHTPAQRRRTKEDAMITAGEDRRAHMSENRSLSRRARVILAMDSLMVSVDGNPGRVTRQDIASKAADWTTDTVDMFAGPGEDDYTDYYELINSLMHIVDALRRGE